MSTAFWRCMAFPSVLLGCSLAWGQAADYESFEEGVPAYFTATQAGGLSVSPWHSMHGKNSLRWEWSKGDELVIRHGIGDVSRTGGFLNRAAFVVCVHMEKPISGGLVFAFREGEKTTGSFRFPLSFTGWQQARVFYDAFPSGKPTSQVDNICISAPANVPQGTTFFDIIRYNTLIYYSASINPEDVARRGRIAPDEKRFPKPALVTEAERAAIRRLMGERPDAGAGGPGIKDAQVDALVEKVKAVGIVRDVHGVRGPCLVRSSFYYAAPGEYGSADIKGWPDEHGPNGIEIGLPDSAPVIGLADAVASAFRESNDAQQRARLLEAFSLLADFLFDQGLSVGLDTIIRLRNVPELVNSLEAHLERVKLSLRADQFFVGEETPVVANMDFYASTGPYRLRNMLRLCGAQRDEAERVRWLNAWKAMLDRSLVQPEGPFKPDGSGYHHQGHYHSYAQNAFALLPALLAELKGTPWIPSVEAQERFRRAMLAQRFYCVRLDKPISLAGRSPFAGGPYDGILPKYGDVAFDAAARLGTPDGKQNVDLEMAVAYLRLVPGAIDTEPYRGLGIKPEPDPQGTFVMPYAALLCQRRDDWLASVKGQSKYCWGSERQARRNAYGLFQGLGNLEILAGGKPVSAAASGRSGAGWDWRRFEGVTAPQLPLAEIDAGWSFVSGTIRSPETFAGGLSHQGRHGLFAMILNLPIKAHTLKGRKSWFFEDDRIVCLGSDLSYDDPKYPVQTTLCQKVLATNAPGAFSPTMIDGNDVGGFPLEQNLDPNSAHWFLDVQQTGYFLPKGQTITVARRHQTSRDVDDAKETQGDFMTAWVDHGNTPAAGGYEYLAVVRASPQTMQAYSLHPPYEVIQRDASAHVVRFAASGRLGCVFFVPQQVTAHAVAGETIPVQSVDRPCLVMVDAIRDGQLSVSVADPDLNLENGASQPRPLRVTLRGAWKLLGATGTLCAWPLADAGGKVRVVSTDAAQTVLEVLCQHGASYDLKLGR